MGQCCSSPGQSVPRHSQAMVDGRARRSKAEADAERAKKETDGIEEVLTPGYVENMYGGRSRGSPDSHSGSVMFHIRY